MTYAQLPPHQPHAPLSLIGRMLRPLMRRLVGGALHAPGATTKRRKVNRLNGLTHALPGARREHAVLGGVPVMWVTYGDLPADAPCVVYLHGGGYMVGSPSSHLPITTRLARDAALRVLAVDYRLAPEHPYPAALNDALAAYQALLDSGTPASRIALAGDSAGGNLTLVLALAIQQRGLPQPACLYCLSPWTDLTASGESHKTCAQAEVLLSSVLTAEFTPAYLGGADPREPLISPLFANLTGLPPLLLQVGGDEILLSDSQMFAAAARSAGVEVTLEQWQACWHVWQLNAGLMPEANVALKRAAAFLTGHLNCNSASTS